MAYEITVNKKFTYVKLYNILKSVKGGQNQISRKFSSLVDKYLFKNKAKLEGRT